MITDANRQQIARFSVIFNPCNANECFAFDRFAGKNSHSEPEKSMAANKSRLKIITAAAVAGLLWSQSASAAAPQLSASVDPLVALSALGTTGSSSAVCGANTQGVDGCALAMNDAAQPADTQVPPPPPEGTVPASAHGMNVLPLLIALGVVVAVGIILASGSNHGSGNLTPVSPG